MPFDYPEMKRIRLDRGLSQRRAAKRAKMHVTAWARLERGELPDPQLQTVERIAHALRVAPMRLIGPIGSGLL
jgi:transcriptional regulator with XRE-family HTH domain